MIVFVLNDTSNIKAQLKFSLERKDLESSKLEQSEELTAWKTEYNSIKIIQPEQTVMNKIKGSEKQSDLGLQFSQAYLSKNCCFDLYLSCIVRKLVLGFPNRSDTNRAVQSQKIARGLKFRI